MRPEISSLVRQLTYPDLIDAPNTQNRPSLRGVRDNVVFVNHSTPEDDASELEERKDVTVKSSKRNTSVTVMSPCINVLYLLDCLLSRFKDSK